MDRGVVYENELNLMETELKLGLPGRDENEEERVSCCKSNKRLLSDSDNELKHKHEASPPVKAQIVGWPPVRSYRKNCLNTKDTMADDGSSGIFVKVSMDGAPYLRKIDLKLYKGYSELVKALEMMFKCIVGDYSEREGYNGSEFVPTYEDKDNDWMLVGDVPWQMFMSSCKRLRIMKGSEAKGLGCGV